MLLIDTLKPLGNGGNYLLIQTNPPTQLGNHTLNFVRLSEHGNKIRIFFVYASLDLKFLNHNSDKLFRFLVKKSHTTSLIRDDDEMDLRTFCLLLLLVHIALYLFHCEPPTCPGVVGLPLLAQGFWFWTFLCALPPAYGVLLTMREFALVVKEKTFSFLTSTRLKKH